MRQREKGQKEGDRERRRFMALSVTAVLCWQLSLMRAKEGGGCGGLGGKQHLGSEVRQRGAKLVHSGSTVSFKREPCR